MIRNPRFICGNCSTEFEPRAGWIACAEALGGTRGKVVGVITARVVSWTRTQQGRHSNTWKCAADVVCEESGEVIQGLPCPGLQTMTTKTRFRITVEEITE